MRLWLGIAWPSLAPRVPFPPALPPALVDAPTLAGTPEVGRSLSLDDGAWNSSLPLTIRRQWLRNGEPIEGASGDSLLLGNADDGQLISCEVIAESSAGATSVATMSLRVKRAAPVAIAPLADLELTQGSSAYTIDCSTLVEGSGIAYSATGEELSIDPVRGLLAISTSSTRAASLTTVTATNTGGSVSFQFLVSVVAASRTIHVSATDGDDQSGDGSATAPVHTLARAKSMAQASDTIALRRGDIWRESVSGLPDGVTLTAFGTGALPIISGADVVAGLVADGVAASEGAGQAADIDHETGNLSEWSSTIVNGGSAIAHSTEQARSGGGSAKLTGDGSDNRVYGRISSLPNVGDGETVHIFAAFYTPTGALKNGTWKVIQRDAQNSAVELTVSGGTVTAVKLNDYNVNVGASLVGPVAVSNWNLDSWNTVEWSYTRSARVGGQEIWINGQKIGESGYTHNTSGMGTFARVDFGNTGFGACFNAGASIYIDDVKVTVNGDPHMAERLGSGDPNIWTAPFSAGEPRQVFVNGVRGQRVATAGAVDGYRKWHWAANTITVYGMNGEEPSVEASVRNDLITLNGTSGVTVEKVELLRAARRAINADTATGFIVQDCTITDPYLVGINSSGNTAGQRAGVRIRRNEISGAGVQGIGFGGRLNDWIIEDNTVSGCGWGSKEHEILPTGWNEWLFEWTGSIKNWGWGGPGWQGQVTVRHNHVFNSRPASWITHKSTHGVGIWWDEVLEPTARHLIHDNIVHDCTTRGVYSEKCDDVDIYNNLVYRCAQVQFTASIEAQSNPYGYDVNLNQPDNSAPRQVSGTRIWNNTAVGGWWALSVAAQSPNTSISNTEVRDNILVGASGSAGQLYIVGGGANNGMNGSGNSYVNNCFGPDGGGRVWGAANYSSIGALEAASNGAIKYTVVGNPLFADPARDDYSLGMESPCIGAASDGTDIGRQS